MKKKKIVSAISCIVLSLSMVIPLSSCGKEVTAESLIENAYPDNLKSMSADVKMDMDVSMDIAGLIGNYDTSSGSAEPVMMPISINADIRMQQNEDVSRTDSDIDINAMGMKENEQETAWYDYLNKKTYTSSDNGSTWLKADMDEFENVTLDDATFNLDKFNDLKLDKDSMGDDSDKYKVTATISYTDLYDSLSTVLDTDKTGITDTGSGLADGNSDLVIDATLKFDKKTKYLTDMSFDFNDKAALANELQKELNSTVTVDKMKFTYTNIEFNKVKNLKIPDDVLDDAKTESELLNDE